MRSVLGLDAGQSGIKVRWRGVGVGERIYPGLLTDAPVLPQLAAVARDVLASLGPVDVVAAGVSGLTEHVADAGALREMIGGVGRAVIAHDSTTSFLGARGGRPGAVVAAGTGVVTLAVGSRSVARVDGWGSIMGDAGSGYWIGREALDAVMRAYDGRAPATRLTDAVTSTWPELPTAYIALQASATRVSRVASFARVVAAAADAGDAVAADITRRAAEELAHSTEAALRRVGMGEASADVTTTGGVFGSAALRSAYSEALAARVPGARIVASEGAGIDGALMLPALPPEHPLLASVWDSGARRATRQG